MLAPGQASFAPLWGMHSGPTSARAARRRCIHALRVCRRTWENSWIRQRRGGERRTIAEFVSGIFTAHQGAPRAPKVLAPGQASFAPLWGMHSGPTSARAARRRCIHALRVCRRTWENSWIRQRRGGERRTIAESVSGMTSCCYQLLLPAAATSLTIGVGSVTAHPGVQPLRFRRSHGECQASP